MDGDYNILCLDDDTGILRTYPRIFRGIAEVTTATNGVEGLAIFRESPEKYDLILTDKEMPGGDGLEFLAGLQMFKLPPTVMLSGVANPELYRQVISFGAKGLICKPFEANLLKTVGKELMRQSASLTLKQYHKEQGYVPAIVLAIDDDADIRDFVAQTIKPHYEVATAEDGRDALSVLNGPAGFDIIVTDYNYGTNGENGLWLANRVKEQYPGVPVVMFTAAGKNLKLQESARASGIVGILKKPLVDIKQLPWVISGILNQEDTTLSSFLDSYFPENL